LEEIGTYKVWRAKIERAINKRGNL
jgi:hypothetical protein